MQFSSAAAFETYGENTADEIHAAVGPGSSVKETEAAREDQAGCPPGVSKGTSIEPYRMSDIQPPQDRRKGFLTERTTAGGTNA